MESLGAGQLTGSQKDELMEQVKQQLAVANAQELLTKMTEKCFKKCVDTPGATLSSYEQALMIQVSEELYKFLAERCVAMCMDRYLDSWNIVSKAYGNRLQRERQKM